MRLHFIFNVGTLKNPKILKIKHGYIDNDDVSEIECDEEGAFSLTYGNDEMMLCQFVKNYFNQRGQKSIIVTDACSGCGGDSMQFMASGVFDHVFSVEYDSRRAKNLAHNMNLTQQSVPHTCTYEVKNESYLDVLSQITQDVVYFDPPWGGLSYKNQKNVSLALDNITIDQIVNLLATTSNTKMVIIKAPINWNKQELQALSEHHKHEKTIKCKKYCFHIFALQSSKMKTTVSSNPFLINL